MLHCSIKFNLKKGYEIVTLLILAVIYYLFYRIMVAALESVITSFI